jgi:hypothetical protein
MSTSVSKKVYLRPTKSPSLPKKSAPNGLTTNPAAKVASVDKSARVGLPAGKNLVAMMAAKLPNM